MIPPTCLPVKPSSVRHRLDVLPPKTLIHDFQTNTWYTAILKIDSDPQLFRVEVFQRDNPGIRGYYTRNMADGLSWRFRHWIYSGSSFLDNYSERTISSDVVYVGNLYEKDLRNGQETKYYYLGSQRIAMRKGGTLSYLLTDHLGSTIGSCDATCSSGSLVNRRYYSFGEPRYTTGTMPSKRLFTGQTFDDSVGLYDYGARWYDPYLARFLSPDMAVPNPNEPQALNRYSYTINNPLKYRDPSGRWIETAFDVAMVALDVAAVSSDPSVVNVAALVVDVAATALPIVPAGAGLIARGGKLTAEAVAHGDEVVKVGTEVVEHADEAVDLAKGLEKGLETAAGETKAAEKAGAEAVSDRPSQVHHFASDKNSQYTPAFQEITGKYKLDLNGDWNKASMPHQGRHPNEYHSWVLDEMKSADTYAQGDQTGFLEYYRRNIMEPVVRDPDMLRSSYWR